MGVQAMQLLWIRYCGARYARGSWLLGSWGAAGVIQVLRGLQELTRPDTITDIGALSKLHAMLLQRALAGALTAALISSPLYSSPLVSNALSPPAIVQKAPFLDSTNLLAATATKDIKAEAAAGCASCALL